MKALHTLHSALCRFAFAPEPSALPVLLLVHLNIVLYAFCYWLCQPVLPFLMKELGADAVAFGGFQTVFSLMQLIGGPWVGRMSDAASPRFAMVVTQMASGLSYVILGLSRTPLMLFVSRIPTALMHCMQVAQAFMASYTTTADRTAAIGRLSLSYGVGMVLGSSTGGLLAQRIGYGPVALTSGVITLALGVLDGACLPSGTHRQPHKKAGSDVDVGSKEQEDKKGGASEGVWAAFSHLVGIPSVSALLLFKLVVGMGFAVFHSTLSMALADKLQLRPSELGYVLTYSAALGTLHNSFTVGWAVALTSEKSMLLYATCTLVACMVGYAYVWSLASLFVLILPLGFATSTIYTVSTALLTEIVPSERQGSVIGLGHATRSACGLIAPTLGGFLLKQHGFSSIGFASAALALAALAVLIVYETALDTKAAHNRQHLKAERGGAIQLEEKVDKAAVTSRAHGTINGRVEKAAAAETKGEGG